VSSSSGLATGNERSLYFDAFVILLNMLFSGEEHKKPTEEFG